MAFDGVGESTDLSTHCDVRAVRVFQVGAGPVQRLTAECGAMPGRAGAQPGNSADPRRDTRKRGRPRRPRKKATATHNEDRRVTPAVAADVAQKKALVVRFTMPFTRDTFENTR